MNYNLNAAKILFDNFNNSNLDASIWLVAEKAWGIGNGGVVSDNVSIGFNDKLGKNTLRLEAHGDRYIGNIKGVDRYGNRIEQTTRVGAAIATRDYFASGKYEVRMKLPENLGVCSALWTFHYEEGYMGTHLFDDLSSIGGLSQISLQSAGLSLKETNLLWNDMLGYKGDREPYIVLETDSTAKMSDYFRAKVWDISKLDLIDDFGKKDN